ncbi:hypothetical protein [Streptomyces sp. NP160]|uniref:hypothetical protein n=1 Tax=Streptomyces sp. NP160 TaxID=2586637 RepID=UPI0015D58D76|nr:hypothetical protein [Streptomyces sp. NP160]
MVDHPRRPAFLGPAALDSLRGGGDPALREEAAQTTARLIVDGARGSEDEQVAARLVGLADEHGLEVLSSLWADAPADSLAGALWRLFALRQWVHADPVGASREFEEGRRSAPVMEVVAGVGDPPGPDEVRRSVDAVLRGLARGDVPTTFERAAAFARVVAAGRAARAAQGLPPVSGGATGRPGGPTESAVRLVRTAEQLEAAARQVRLERFEASAAPSDPGCEDPPAAAQDGDGDGGGGPSGGAPPTGSPHRATDGPGRG